MKTLFYFSLVASIGLLASCSDPLQDKFHVKVDDFKSYLESTPEAKIREAEANLAFWASKLKDTPNQFPYHTKIAAVETQLFNLTGNISHLKNAESHLSSAYAMSGMRGAALQRALAHNFITQHCFQEALDLLVLAEADGENRAATNKMLFDVYLELGQKSMAEKYLLKFRNENDFDYLIRKAKWEDHNSDLQQAIMYMELALDAAKQRNNPDLIQWAHTNLADFYGHDGRIADAYTHYLAALAIDPADAYAKKGLAWIAYSHEKDTKLATEILESVTTYYHAPDYHLLQAEIAAFNGNVEGESKHLNAYLSAVSDTQYGVMYNTYNISLSQDGYVHVAEALRLAQQEVRNRPTPMSYSFLALAQLENGDPKKALLTIQENVAGQSTEPMLQYHMAEVYKANALAGPLAEVKSELLGASYELGPVMMEKIRAL